MSTIAFCHIPKTAGTSLNFVLRRHFGSKLLAVVPRNNNLYEESDLVIDTKKFNSVECISGHGLKPYTISDTSLNWITFLRNPKLRFISQYIHQQTNGDPKYQMGLEEWAEKFERSNWQVKWIAGEENLDKALEIIENRFGFIGLTEKFDLSLLLMKEVLGLPDMDLRYGKGKMKVRDNQLKKDILSNKEKYDQLINENNELDNKLYDYVDKEIFPRYMKNHQADYWNDLLQNFNEANKVFKSNFLHTLPFKMNQKLFYETFNKMSR